LPDFDLQTYLKNEMQSQPQVIAHLRFDSAFTNLLSGNYSYWDSVETKPDGSVEVTFPSPTLEWAASTTLAYGPAVEVLEPAELRIMVTEWIAAIASKYNKNKDSSMKGA
jgi:predicted DNA-binding transcriptional regulator YafY